MIRLGIIGLGTISHVQQRALAYLQNEFAVTAVSDVNVARMKGQYNSAHVIQCQSLEEFVSLPGFDAGVVSTPPDTHARITAELLAHGKHAIVEKPMVTSWEDYVSLRQRADRSGCFLYAALHAAFGVEVEWYLRAEEGRGGAKMRGREKRIRCGFFDPYIGKSGIPQQLVRLGGSFWDGGINGLSVCARLLGLSGHAWVEEGDCRHVDGTVCHSFHRMRDGTRTLEVETGWDWGIDRKASLIEFENGDGLLLDHSRQQAVWAERGSRAWIRAEEYVRGEPDRHQGADSAGGGVCLFKHSGQERLVAQYVGMFRDFLLSHKQWRNGMKRGENAEMAERILWMMYLCEQGMATNRSGGRDDGTRNVRNILSGEGKMP